MDLGRTRQRTTTNGALLARKSQEGDRVGNSYVGQTVVKISFTTVGVTNKRTCERLRHRALL